MDVITKNIPPSRFFFLSISKNKINPKAKKNLEEPKKR